MKQYLDMIFGLRLEFKLAILAGLLVLIGALFWFQFYGPLREEVNASEDEVNGPNGLKVQIATEEGKKRNLGRFKEGVKKLNVELEKALQELPDKKEIPNLLSKISDKARDAGLEVELFRPKGEQKREFYAEVPVNVKVNGTYHQVATFFDEVGRLERIVNLDDFSMTEPSLDPDSVWLKTSVVATAFRFLDESERVEAERGKKKKKRRRKKKKE